MQQPKKHRILLATTNKKKIEQYKEVIDSLYGRGAYRPFTLHTLTPKMLERLDAEPAEENGASTMENAVIKAQHYASLTGMITISDDSAFCVDALGGAPGLTSHRGGWGQTEVLRRLYKCNNPYRRAHYVASVVCCIPKPNFECASIIGTTRTLHGTVIEPMMGKNAAPVFVQSKQNYGYDAIFRPSNTSGGVGFSGTVDGLLHSGDNPRTRLGLGYPRAVAFHEVFTRAICLLCPF